MRRKTRYIFLLSNIDTGVIYPRSIQGDWKLDSKDQNRVIQMVNENNVEIIGIGNRTGFREMERIIVNLIQKSVFNHKVTFTSVNEDGASIYRYIFIYLKLVKNKILQQNYSYIHFFQLFKRSE